MELEITGEETGEQLIKLLVKARHVARNLNKARDVYTEAASIWDESLKQAEEGTAQKERAAQGIAQCKEALLDIRFGEVELGHFTMTLSRHLDAKADRQDVLEALNVGLAARKSDEYKKYGKTTASLIYTLQLENSSSRRGEDWDIPPLAWCCHLAFMNKMTTDPEFDRASHDALNEVFNGYWGEYQERPLMERLVGRAV